MPRFAIQTTIILDVEDDTDPVATLDEILSGHDKLKGNYAIDQKTSIVPDGDWTFADQYQAMKVGWCIVTDENGQEFIGAAKEVSDSRVDLIAQRWVIRTALLEDDHLSIRAIRYMKRSYPSQFNAMVQRVLHQT